MKLERPHCNSSRAPAAVLSRTVRRHRATFVNRLFRHTGLIFVFVATSVAAQDQSKTATPAEQYRSLHKELQGAAAGYFQTTNETERLAMVTRVDAATVKLLELVERNSREPFALEALTQ